MYRGRDAPAKIGVVDDHADLHNAARRTRATPGRVGRIQDPSRVEAERHLRPLTVSRAPGVDR
ncbi:hypothetical protein [Rhodococcus sp. NBC_00294]|uniref:hypothetical protein n=1 Tax=Rhodococcus sp. NBC_00294 TaxID=2976004 RepID=UPI002E27D58F|nr:hypothetical protein [Rhodococcus sp. NBC_00294]